MKKFRQILEGTLSSNKKTEIVRTESDAAYAASLKKIAMDKQINSLSNRDRDTLARIADMMKNANNDRKEDISENDMSLDDIKKKWAKEIIAYQDGDINQLRGSAEMDLYGYRDDDAIKTDDADEFEDFVMGLQMAKYKKESVDENLRKDIAQMSAKFPEGSTVKLKNGKTGKVLGVTKDRVNVGFGNETSYHAPTAIEETTLAQQQRDKTKSQHDAHAKRMNKSARDSIKKYDQVKKDRDAAAKRAGVGRSGETARQRADRLGHSQSEEMNEAIDSKDYKLDSERSQFNDGHRGKVVHKEKGTTMYLGSMSWKTPNAAKGHANAYLMGYEIGGEEGARKAQAKYVDQNMNKRTMAKKESFLSYTEGAKEDALRAIKNDRDFKQVKDVDIRATTADMKLAKKNPIQQLRKISDQGRGQMEFLNNKKLKVSKQEADALLRGFDAMKKPQDKEKYQTMISKDSAGLKRILKIVNK